MVYSNLTLLCIVFSHPLLATGPSLVSSLFCFSIIFFTPLDTHTNTHTFTHIHTVLCTCFWTHANVKGYSDVQFVVAIAIPRNSNWPSTSWDDWFVWNIEWQPPSLRKYHCQATTCEEGEKNESTKKAIAMSIFVHSHPYPYCQIYLTFINQSCSLWIYVLCALLCMCVPMSFFILEHRKNCSEHRGLRERERESWVLTLEANCKKEQGSSRQVLHYWSPFYLLHIHFAWSCFLGKQLTHPRTGLITTSLSPA